MIKGESRKSAALNEREDGKLIDHMFWKAVPQMASTADIKKDVWKETVQAKGIQTE